MALIDRRVVYFMGSDVIYLRLLASILSWVGYLTLVAVPSYILGLILVPIAAAFRALESRDSVKFTYPHLTQWRWRFMYPWGNEEDGVDGLRGHAFWPDGRYMQRRWIDKTANWSWWRRIIIWSAIRNPAGNLRFVKPFGCIPDAKRTTIKVWSTANTFLTYTYQGVYSGLRVELASGAHFRIGWDGSFLTPNDYRLKGLGFKLLIRRA